MKLKCQIVYIVISLVLFSSKAFALITGPNIICKNGVGVFKTTLNVGGFYTWTGPPNTTVISGQGTNTVVIKFQQSGGKVYVKQGGVLDSLDIILSDLPLPNVSIGSNKTLPICAGSEIALTGSGADSLRWLSNVTNGVSFTPGEVLFDNFISLNTYNTTSLKIADIDGDGWEDIIAGFDQSQTLRIYRNRGLAGQVSGSTFELEVIIESNPIARLIEIGDFNNDGKADIAVAFNNNSVSIYKNNCTIGNIAASNFSKTDILPGSGSFFEIRAIPLSDLNNDGKLDIMVNLGTGKLRFFKNNNIGSSISFAGFEQNLFDEKQTTYYSTFADIDNDGYKDLCANYYVSFLGVLKNANPNNGLLVDSNASAYKWVSPVDGFYNLEVADFNSDNYLDFASGSFAYIGNGNYGYKLSLFQNKSKTGPINFGSKVDLSLNSRSRGLLTTDLNLDGKKDLLVCTDNLNFKKLSYFINSGGIGDISSNQFPNRVDVDCGFNSNGIVEADINKDGRKDFVAFGNTGIHFFSNKTNHFQLLGIAANGCSNVAEIQINPSILPIANINPSGTVSRCINESVVLKASKGIGYSYIWQQGNDTLYGSNADSLHVLSTGTYKVIITNSANCSAVSAPVLVAIAPNITNNTIVASSIVCEGTVPSIIIGLTPDGGGGNFQYAWYSATDTNGVWTKVGTSKDYSPPMITQDTYFKRGVKGITCNNEVFSNTHIMQLKPTPIAQFEIDKAYQCFPSNQFFFEDKTIWPHGAYQREWDFGDGSKDTAALVAKSYASLKNYTVTLSINSIYGCKDIESKTVSFPSFNEGQNICLLRVDEPTQKNAIVWQRKLGSQIAAYRIYKETNTTNVFEPIGLSPADSMGYFLDLSSDPISRSNRYKISILDTCGNEGPLSEPHKTLHLAINQGINNTYNLIWEPYIGLEPQTINIYRGSNSNNLGLLANLPASVFQFVDQNPLQGNNYYMVELVFGVSCDPTILLKKAFNSSTSNIASSIPSALQEVAGLKSVLVNIGPNPFQNEVKVYPPNGQAITLEIFDIQGRKMKQFELLNDVQSINTSDFEEGVYIFSIYENGRAHQVRMIKRLNLE